MLPRVTGIPTLNYGAPPSPQALLRNALDEIATSGPAMSGSPALRRISTFLSGQKLS